MIAIFAAMEVETRACLPALTTPEHRAGRFPAVHADGVAICQTGLGRIAREAADDFIREHDPQAVLSVGTAGGLAPDVALGEIVLCDRVWHSQEPGSAAGNPDLIKAALAAAEGEGLTARRGGSVTVDTVAWSPEEKAVLRASGAPDIVEMESFWIGQAAASRGLPYLAIRAISDDANNRLVEIPGLFDDRGRVDSVSLLEFTRQHPEVIAELAAQHERGGLALANLSRFLRAFLPRLKETP